MDVFYWEKHTVCHYSTKKLYKLSSVCHGICCLMSRVNNLLHNSIYGICETTKLWIHQLIVWFLYKYLSYFKQCIRNHCLQFECTNELEETTITWMPSKSCHVYCNEFQCSKMLYNYVLQIKTSNTTYIRFKLMTLPYFTNAVSHCKVVGLSSFV